MNTPVIEEDMLNAYEELLESGFDMSDANIVAKQLQSEGYFIDSEQVLYISQNQQYLRKYFETAKEFDTLFEK